MSVALMQLESRTIVKVDIDGAGLLSDGLMLQLSNALDQAEDIGPTAVMLLHIAGQPSSSHAHYWPGQTHVAALSRWERLVRRIERSSVMTIALVEQSCSGLALELLLVVDRRLSKLDFSVMQEPGGSIWPSMALYRLSRQIGYARARRIYLDDRGLSAALAIEVNIVDEYVTDLANAMDRVAHLLTNAPLDDFAVRCRLMQDSVSTSFDDALGAHLAACDRALRRIPEPHGASIEPQGAISAV